MKLKWKQIELRMNKNCELLGVQSEFRGKQIVFVKIHHSSRHSLRSNWFILWCITSTQIPCWTWLALFQVPTIKLISLWIYDDVERWINPKVSKFCFFFFIYLCVQQQLKYCFFFALPASCCWSRDNKIDCFEPFKSALGTSYTELISIIWNIEPLRHVKKQWTQPASWNPFGKNGVFKRIETIFISKQGIEIQSSLQSPQILHRIE